MLRQSNITSQVFFLAMLTVLQRENLTYHIDYQDNINKNVDRFTGFFF